MKKTLLSLAGLAMAGVLAGGIANAELDITEAFPRDVNPTVESFQRLLTEYSVNRGFEDYTSPIEQGVSTNGVKFTYNKIRDDTTTEATQYRLFVSPYRVKDIREGNSKVDPSNIVIKNVKWEKGKDIVNFDVNLDDKIDPSHVYYGFITPIEEYDGVGKPSQEFCFMLENEILNFGEDACNSLALLYDPAEEINVEDTTSLEGEVEEHGSAKACDAGMDLANISHTVKNNKITLTWTSLGECEVMIAIMDPTEEEFVSIGNAKMSDEKFEYNMKRNGEQIFMLNNGIKEHVYKVDAVMTEEVVEKGIVTPQTGATQNMILIMVAALIIYGAYTVFFRKNEN